MSSLAIADVNLNPPTAYTNGDPLAIQDIDKFEICVSNVPEGTCTSMITVPNTATKVEGIPGDTMSIKGRTIPNSGPMGDYGPEFTEPFKFPLPPGFYYTITLSVGTR